MYPLSVGHTCTFDAITNPSWSTVAFEAASCVGAGSLFVTVMGSDLTLIDIWGETKEKPCKEKFL